MELSVILESENRDYYPIIVLPESIEIIWQQAPITVTPTPTETIAANPREQSKSISRAIDKKKRSKIEFGVALLLFCAVLVGAIIYLPVARFIVAVGVIVTAILTIFPKKKKEDNKTSGKTIFSPKGENQSPQKVVNRNIIPKDTKAELEKSLLERESIYDFVFDDTAKKGASEGFFLNYLQKAFNQEKYLIHEHAKFKMKMGKMRVYQPTADFLLIDKEYNLGVDIEIDEPYTLKDKKPCHCKEDKWYVMRDKFFSQEKNYIVVHFAEYQIIKYPQQCCDFIKFILDLIAGEIERKETQSFACKAEGLGSSANSPKPKRVECWGKAESLELAKYKFREKLLEEINV